MMRAAYRRRTCALAVHSPSVRFLWRCIRMGMWKTPWARRLVYRKIVRHVPVVRRRLVREPADIMRAAAEMRGAR
jgi:hypothetical protein